MKSPLSHLVRLAVLAGFLQAATAADNLIARDDAKITQDILQAVVRDGNLSMYAKNVTISTVNGQVTLRGPVTLEQERKIIDKLAKEAAGTTSVVNLLVVHQ